MLEDSIVRITFRVDEYDISQKIYLVISRIPINFRQINI